MPLERGKSKAAFSHNISAEVHAGKPQKQAVAIAYSEKAKAEHKKHLAMGGKVSSCEMCMGGYDSGGYIQGGTTLGNSLDPDKRKQFHFGSDDSNPPPPPPPPQQEAEGGEIMDDSDYESMMDQCADECMKAIEMKDKEGFRDAFHVLVADILNKLSSDMDGE